MSIGEVLTAAQREAGLTVADVSRRTRIRETIVRQIERDDFSSCGGDFYARGHVRAIAHVLGVDPEPLVREYDASRTPPAGPGGQPSAPAARPSGLGRQSSAQGAPPSPPGIRSSAQGAPPSAPAARSSGLGAPPSRGEAEPPEPGTGRRSPERRQPDTEPGTRGASAGSGPLRALGSAPEIPVFPPPGRPGAAAPAGPLRYREPRRPNWTAALLVLLAIVAGLIIYHVVSAHPAGSGTAAGKSAAVHKPAHGHPAAAKTLAPSSSPAPADVVISLTAVSEACWVNLTTSSGATIFQGVVQPGSSQTWSERAAVTLQLGNPGAVTLTVDGKSRTGLGSDPVTLTLGPGQGTAS